MTRVLVTGATGFIASRTVRPLADLGFEVHAAGLGTEIPAGAKRLHTDDLLVPGVPTSLVERVKPTHILHAAWYVEHGAFWTSPTNIEWVRATAELIGAACARGVTRFVGLGTCAEYDWTDRSAINPCREDGSAAQPATLYGACKLAACMTVLRAHKSTFEDPISSAWARLFMQYGPNDGAKRLIPDLCARLLRGETASCRSGSHTRDFIHTDDLGRALAALVVSDLTGPVNVASGTAVSLGEITRLLGELTGRPELVEIEDGADTDSNPRHLSADVSKLAMGTSWSPTVALREGLAAVVDERRALVGSA